MVLDPLCYYFVFLIYTDGYSNHYGCVWRTVLAVNSGICKQKIWEFENSKLLFLNFFIQLNKSVLISFFDLPFTNTKIISQYRLTYTPHSGLNSLPLYEIERSWEQIFIIYRWQHAYFKSVFYKSLIRACSFENSLVASQNARNYGQTFKHRALRICKKRT